MLAEAQAFLKSNPILAGGAGMAVMGWAVMQAKSLPQRIWRTFQDQFSTTITIYSEDTAFRNVSVWLAQHPSAKRTRRFNIAFWYNPRKDAEDYILTPGEGLHVLRDGWRVYLVNRKVDQNQAPSFGGGDRKQTITITTFGRSQEPLRRMLDEIMAVREDRDTIPIYTWIGGGYSLVERRAKRPMDTVYIDPAIKADILRDVQRFTARRSWYADRAIPWRRGYSLEGPPGTGKTTLIFAIASVLEKPVYLINPASLDNDNQLQAAVNQAGAGLLAIEDIDTLKVSKRRKSKVNTASEIDSTPSIAPPGAGSTTVSVTGSSDNSKSGITLSGLLNAFDGIGARDGRILLLTSNHAETLDPALMRPGRVDRRYTLGRVSEPQAREMHTRFFPDRDPGPFLDLVRPELPLPAADLQNRLLCMAEEA